ncbi:TetR/AcrR family transcriptional regulator [Catenulispora rubra]|uniref:TetR/AcrR family transcriptional regulator n=1 Tax=Catenulispora rubra TaxID=280293 RepID=UPI00189243B3|nr:TetR family transcriptional regulator [Catenulispora rubra]
MRKPSAATMDRIDAIASAGTADRRERKKNQTREALVYAALDLFEAKGYEETTVREITDAVDVASRTFFRYFANKDDLVLGFARDFQEGWVLELGTRPADEEPLTALRNAFAARSRELMKEHPNRQTTDIRVLKLIENTPSLLAAQLRNSHERAADVINVLAAREGVDPDADLRPHVATTVFLSLVALSAKQLSDEDATSEDVLAALDKALEHLQPALAGHWGPPAGT